MFKKLFKKHPDFVLISLAILLLGVLVVSFVWGITTIFTTFNKAISVGDDSKEGSAMFNLQVAKELDLRGLVR